MTEATVLNDVLMWLISSLSESRMQQRLPPPKSESLAIFCYSLTFMLATFEVIAFMTEMKK